MWRRRESLWENVIDERKQVTHELSDAILAISPLYRNCHHKVLYRKT